MPKTDENKNLKKSLVQRAYRYMTLLFGLYFATAILGAIVGRWLDDKFDIHPKGMLLSLGTFWIIALLLSKLIIGRLNSKK